MLRRTFAALQTAPPVVQAIAGAFLILTVWFAVNWVYQAIRKPSEVFYPVNSALIKTLPGTWHQYGLLFKEHSTQVITADLLAALAQVEGGGSPVAQTYWQWRAVWNPFGIYKPASSAVGMYQITDATFTQAKRYCIHNHVAVEDGPWHDMKSCWFNGLYWRVLPSHAIELTAAHLDRSVATMLHHEHLTGATLQQKQDLAAVIHLCGAGTGGTYARRGFRLTAGQRCGDHDVKNYLSQVNRMKRLVVRLAAAD